MCEVTLAQLVGPRVRFWPKADTPKNAINVTIGGKADMTFCGANVRF